ncbi:MAG: Flp pilus assembly protein CpaB [Marinobacter sp.]|nr:Flp pilus assembly protein CpaB [Marinobacter sp.]
MNKRILYTAPAIVIALLALAMAIAGLWLTQAPAESKRAEDSQPTEPAAPRFEYLVAKNAVTPGTPITRDAFMTVASESPVPEAIAASSAPFGEPVKTAVSAGQILRASHLRSDSVLDKLIEPGFQAMAVPVDDLSGVGGLLRPGDRVDVVAAFRRSDEDTPAAVRLLRNVLVVAVHGVPHVGEPIEGNDQKRNKTVVLSVPTDRVSQLLLASSEGQVRLVASGDENREPEKVAESPSKDRATYLDDLFPKPPRPAPRHTPVRQVRTQVEVYEGAESRNVYVR